MSTEDFLAVAIAILGIVSGFLAFLVTLFPPAENARRKKRAWLMLFATLAAACIVLIPWQQTLSSDTRKKNERVSVEFREVKGEATQLANALNVDASDPSAAIREALSKLSQLSGEEDRLKRCEAAANAYANSLVDRSNLRNLTPTASSDPPETVLDKAASRIRDLESSIGALQSSTQQCGTEISDLTQKYQKLVAAPIQCPTPSFQCPSSEPTFCSNRWPTLSSSRLDQLSYELSKASKQSQSVWVTYYHAKDSQALANEIGYAFAKVSWKEPKASGPSSDGETFGIAVYGGDAIVVDGIIRAITAVVGNDAAHAASHDEVGAKLTSSAKNGLPKDVYEIAVGCRAEHNP